MSGDWPPRHDVGTGSPPLATGAVNTGMPAAASVAAGPVASSHVVPRPAVGQAGVENGVLVLKPLTSTTANVGVAAAGGVEGVTGWIGGVTGSIGGVTGSMGVVT